VGPRGKITLDPLADWHLFLGDTSGLAAFYRMAESIETPGRAIFVVEVDDIDDALTAPFDEGLGVTGIFVERNGRAYDDPAGLLGGLAAFEMPAHEGHAYSLASSTSCARSVSRSLIAECKKSNSVTRRSGALDGTTPNTASPRRTFKTRREQPATPVDVDTSGRADDPRYAGRSC